MAVQDIMQRNGLKQWGNGNMVHMVQTPKDPSETEWFWLCHCTHIKRVPRNNIVKPQAIGQCKVHTMSFICMENCNMPLIIYTVIWMYCYFLKLTVTFLLILHLHIFRNSGSQQGIRCNMKTMHSIMKHYTVNSLCF